MRRARRSWKHIAGHLPEYMAWWHARQRCGDPRHPDYRLYGARGIRMHAAWVEDFDAFFDHIGPRPKRGWSIDRIDNARGYEPGNVRWATPGEQNRNRRPTPRQCALRNKFGLTFTSHGLMKQLGLSRDAVYARLRTAKSAAELLRPRHAQTKYMKGA